jgi:hypothetical protein
MLNPVGRLLIYAGIALVIAGTLVLLAERFGVHLGRLPGDIRYEGRRGTFYFPLMTCVLISLLLSLISWLFNRR